MEVKLTNKMITYLKYDLRYECIWKDSTVKNTFNSVVWESSPTVLKAVEPRMIILAIPSNIETSLSHAYQI